MSYKGKTTKQYQHEYYLRTKEYKFVYYLFNRNYILNKYWNNREENITKQRQNIVKLPMVKKIKLIIKIV